MNFESPTSYSTYWNFFFQIIKNSTLMCRSSAAIRISGFLFNGRRYSNAEMMTLFPEDEAIALSLVG
jgi:hypothetical protein